MDNEIYFISGHLNLSEQEFNEQYVPILDNAIDEGARFVVGDDGSVVLA